MIAFEVRQGTKIEVITRDGRIEPKTMKCTKLYFLEDVVIDPLGKVGPTAERYGRGGCYGFKVEPRHPVYSTILVPAAACRTGYSD